MRSAEHCTQHLQHKTKKIILVDYKQVEIGRMFHVVTIVIVLMSDDYKHSVKYRCNCHNSD